MRFLTALKSKVSIDAIVDQFLNELKEQCRKADGNLCYQFTSNFINECLLAIDLRCDFTAEQIEKLSTKDYPWPKPQIQIYTFHYNPLKFNHFELFLFKVALKIANNQINRIKESQNAENQADGEECLLTFLLESFVRILAIWCNVFQQLKSFEAQTSIKRFDEPLARINFHLMFGLQKLKTMCELNFPLLDKAWDRLFWSALDGLHYAQTHSLVLDGVLDLIQRDFKFFQDQLQQVLLIVNVGLTIEHEPESRSKIFQCLQNVLKKYYQMSTANKDEALESKFETLFNFLISSDMIDIYYTIFLSYKTSKWEEVKMEALKFIQLLIKKLDNLDQVAAEFMGAILQMILKSNNAELRGLAGTVYIAMMKLKFPNSQDILRMTLEFFITYMQTFELKKLRCLIYNICNNFSYFGNFKSFIKLMVDEEVTESNKTLAAWVLFSLFDIRRHFLKNELNADMIKFVKFLPNLFKHINCQRKINILLQIYQTMSVDQWTQPVMVEFTNYVLCIVSDQKNRFSYGLLMTLLSIYNTCLGISEDLHEDFQLMVQKVHEDFLESVTLMEEAIQASLEQDNNDVISFSEKDYIQSFCITMRINILLKMHHANLNLELRDLERLVKIFVDKKKSPRFPYKSIGIFTLHIMEIINSCIIQRISVHNLDVRNIAINLIQYIWKEFTTAMTGISIVYVKTYVNIIFSLYRTLFKMNQMNYECLIQIVLMAIFLRDAKTNTYLRDKVVMDDKTSRKINANNIHLPEINPTQLLSDQKLIMKQIILIHQKCDFEQIDSSVAWKLCIFYGLKSHNLNQELKQLIVAIFECNFRRFVKMMGIIIFNLYDRNPKLKSSVINHILHEYKALFDNDVECETPAVISIQVVLAVLDTVKSSLKTTALAAGVNRLISLSNLEIFFDNIYNQNSNIIEILLEQSSGLPQLNSIELKTLEHFRSKVENMRNKNKD